MKEVWKILSTLQFVANICLKTAHNPPPTSSAHWSLSWQQEMGRQKGILFYRAHYLAGNVTPIDALCQGLAQRHLEPIPVFVSSPGPDAS